MRRTGTQRHGAQRPRTAPGWCEKWLVSGWLAALLLGASAAAPAADALDEDDRLEVRTRQWQDVRLNGGLRVRGVEVGDRAWLGQTRIGGQWGVGLVIDRGDHAYAAGNQGLLILKRF